VCDRIQFGESSWLSEIAPLVCVNCITSIQSTLIKLGSISLFGSVVSLDGTAIGSISSFKVGTETNSQNQPQSIGLAKNDQEK